MSFVDVGTSRRRRMTPTRALGIWERHRGCCVLCKQPIDGARDKWFIEHIRALELGGEDKDENCGPAHYTCKPAKDAADHSAASQAKRRKRHHLGIKDTRSQPIPGSRRSPWKRKMNGQLVRRDP